MKPCPHSGLESPTALQHALVQVAFNAGAVHLEEPIQKSLGIGEDRPGQAHQAKQGVEREAQRRRGASQPNEVVKIEPRTNDEAGGKIEPIRPRGHLRHLPTSETLQELLGEGDEALCCFAVGALRLLLFAVQPREYVPLGGLLGQAHRYTPQ